MILQSERLTLRRYDAGDLEHLFAILSDPITMRYWPRPLTREETRAWIDRNVQRYAQDGFGRYAVELRATGVLIGDAGIVAATVAGEPVNDLGYIIHHPYHGHGYASEVAAALKAYAFATLRLDALHANMPFDHAASRRVAEKIGLQRIKEFVNERNRDIRTFLYTVERHQQEAP